MHFRDRVEAGEKLAQALKKYQGLDAVIYALPRGGVVVGAQIARELNLPLDLIIIRKIGHPFSPEYAICAIGTNGHMVCNEEEVKEIDKAWFEKKIEEERKEAKRRQETYLKGKKGLSAKGKIAIVVDDGIATGLTAETAILEVKHQKPQKIVLAAPVIPPDVAQKFRSEDIEVIALDEPKEFLGAVGAYYDYFPQVGDEEVINLMRMYGPK